jgi:hypothetical protein
MPILSRGRENGRSFDDGDGLQVVVCVLSRVELRFNS